MTLERDLIGLCLKNRQGLEQALACGVSADTFSDPVCASAFAAMVEADRDGKAVNVGNIATKLGPQLVDDVLKIVTSSPTVQNVAHYAKRAFTAAWIRRNHEALRDVAAAMTAWRDDEPLDRLREMAMAVLDDIAAGADPAATGPKRIGDEIGPWRDDLEARINGQKATSNIPSGFTVLDAVMNGGWHRGALCVVGARAGRGKTTFAISAAINAAFDGCKTLFATVEMTARDIITKIVSNIAQVNGGAYISANLDESDRAKTELAVSQCGPLPLWIDDGWRGSFDSFVATCRRLKRRGGLDLVFLDYIGLTKMRGRHDSRREEVVAISMACKALAMELDIAVVVLAQLNRQAEEVEVPGKEHLADSDNLGRDPDAVLTIFRRQVLDENGAATGKEETLINIAKNRWGIETKFPVEARLDISKFGNVAPDARLDWDTFRS